MIAITKRNSLTSKTKNRCGDGLELVTIGSRVSKLIKIFDIQLNASYLDH